MAVRQAGLDAFWMQGGSLVRSLFFPAAKLSRAEIWQPGDLLTHAFPMAFDNGRVALLVGMVDSSTLMLLCAPCPDVYDVDAELGSLGTVVVRDTRRSEDYLVQSRKQMKETMDLMWQERLLQQCIRDCPSDVPSEEFASESPYPFFPWTQNQSKWAEYPCGIQHALRRGMHLSMNSRPLVSRLPHDFIVELSDRGYFTYVEDNACDSPYSWEYMPPTMEFHDYLVKVLKHEVRPDQRTCFCCIVDWDALYDDSQPEWYEDWRLAREGLTEQGEDTTSATVEAALHRLGIQTT
ncbi:hypothetical protein DACRYDRAFT_109010 [Dacryopinax primogenitus]|uniref:Uncharacterized protein n=1 Tax=Dacryopinax primogenitus (strain DJM 731) TaxID=1858805 RepID=M5G906_DACPD|nr:uncharacterized protein DACRYDRAFT_109010 [Dacryopinax primogenitus]EJU00263.1 hypothetical protein DACRYDRAFT_109010 [Dacryopinax primogenitus]